MPRLILALILFAALPAAAQQPGTPGKFDYYVLALSWSPSFCETESGKGAAEQCAPGRRHGFVVHGLWPQYQQGGWPAHCAAPAPLPSDLVRSMLPIMPSRKLVDHQWRKHGTCQGGEPGAYFAATRAAFDRIAIPPPLKAPATPLSLSAAQVERLFAQYNPGLDAQSLVVTCRGRKIAEIRVCLDKDLGFRACGSDLRDRCKGDILFPPVR